MKAIILAGVVLALSGCSVMDRYTASIPTQSVTTPYQGATAQAAKPKPVAKELICSKFDLKDDASTYTEVLNPNYPFGVVLEGKTITLKANDFFQSSTTFNSEPVLKTPTRSVARGWAGKQVVDVIVNDKNELYVNLHTYNVPVDKSFDGLTHNQNTLRHFFLSDCK